MEANPVLVPIVVALTEAAKAFGVKGKLSLLIAILSGMALVVGGELFPAETKLVMEGLVVGLSAIGLYGLGKRAGRALNGG